MGAMKGSQAVQRSQTSTGYPLRYYQASPPSNTVAMPPILDAHVEDAHDAVAGSMVDHKIVFPDMCAREEAIQGWEKR